MKLTTVQS